MEKKEMNPKGCIGFVIFVVVIAVVIAMCSDDPETDKNPRQTQIEAQFHPWDGAHINLERFIKKQLNDPKSYEHIESTYFDQGDHLIVILKYRANNMFGGKVPSYIKAKVSLDGELLEIIDTGN